MSPQDIKIQELERRVAEMEMFFESFKTAANLDPQIQRTMSEILSAPSSKSATSENQPVDEGGSASYSVLGVPDRFIKIGDQNIPAYND